MRQRELEMRLEAIPPIPDPRPEWEQYRTPSRIAADLLYRAFAAGHIQGRRVLDLGCGTGIFAYGASLLGAAAVAGRDIDMRAIEVARRTAADLGYEADFGSMGVEAVDGRFDTVLMNPPFGAQHAARHLDTVFVTAASRLAPTAYSLHLSETGPHLQRLAGRLGIAVEVLTRYEFPLPAQFRFHRKPVQTVAVDLYRFQERAPAP